MQLINEFCTSCAVHVQKLFLLTAWFMFVAEAMKRIEEIKTKRQNHFIVNRFVFVHCSCNMHYSSLRGDLVWPGLLICCYFWVRACAINSKHSSCDEAVYFLCWVPFWFVKLLISHAHRSNMTCLYLNQNAAHGQWLLSSLIGCINVWRLFTVNSTCCPWPVITQQPNWLHLCMTSVYC